MTAEEMFKELGYELTYDKEDAIKYYDRDSELVAFEFLKNDYEIIINPAINIYSWTLKAINKQVEELGWKNN